MQEVSLNRRALELLGGIDSGNFKDWLGKVHQGLETCVDMEIANPSGELTLRVVSLQSQQRGYLLLLEDITGQTKNAEQWLIAEKMAAIGRLSSGLAHEIGTPLNIISGRAELIHGMQVDACQKCETRQICPLDKHLDVIFTQIERITRIIQQLLAQAREGSALKQDFSINDSVTKVADFLQPRLDEHDIQLHLNLRKDLPAIYGFSDQFQQVLINLIMNSIDALSDKQDGIVEVATGVSGDHVTLAVRDNGCGILAENTGKIFDPFFTTKEFGKGTGLGLSVTANIVRSHSVTIAVESRPGEGTRFTIQLPHA